MKLEEENALLNVLLLKSRLQSFIMPYCLSRYNATERYFQNYNCIFMMGFKGIIYWQTEQPGRNGQISTNVTAHQNWIKKKQILWTDQSLGAKQNSKISIPFLFFNLIYLFLISGWLLYNIALVFAIHQHESAIGIPISPPCWNSLSSSIPSHPSMLLQSPSLNSLSHTANSHWLFNLRMVVYMFKC